MGHQWTIIKRQRLSLKGPQNAAKRQQQVSRYLTALNKKALDELIQKYRHRLRRKKSTSSGAPLLLFFPSFFYSFFSFFSKKKKANDERFGRPRFFPGMERTHLQTATHTNTAESVCVCQVRLSTMASLGTLLAVQLCTNRVVHHFEQRGGGIKRYLNMFQFIIFFPFSLLIFEWGPLQIGLTLSQVWSLLFAANPSPPTAPRTWTLSLPLQNPPRIYLFLSFLSRLFWNRVKRKKKKIKWTGFTRLRVYKTFFVLLSKAPQRCDEWPVS